jgi:hypothetical protein
MGTREGSYITTHQAMRQQVWSCTREIAAFAGEGNNRRVREVISGEKKLSMRWGHCCYIAQSAIQSDGALQQLLLVVLGLMLRDTDKVSGVIHPSVYPDRIACLSQQLLTTIL